MTTLRADVAVAGAGLAGLSLALDLARAGRRVLLLERRRRPGGAVQTLAGGADNSIHLFLSGFERCLARLDQLGSRHHLRELGTSCRVDWQGRILTLPLGASRWGTLLGLSRLGGSGLRLVAGLSRVTGAQTRVGESAEDLLSRQGVKDGLVDVFWREWALSVFNAPLDLLDGALFTRTAAAVLGNPRRHRPLIAAGSLDELWIAPFEQALERAGARLLSACALRAVERHGLRVGAFLADGLRVEAEHFVWAGPPEGMAGLPGLSDVALSLPPRQLGRHIVNLIQPVAGEVGGNLRGWFDAPFQWAFPAGDGRVALVGSGWTDADLDPRAERQARVPELLGRHGLRPVGAPRWIVQRHATHLQSPAFEAARPGPETALENLHLCGAWLKTGLPLSMESALAGAELSLGNLPFD